MLPALACSFPGLPTCLPACWPACPPCCLAPSPPPSGYLQAGEAGEGIKSAEERMKELEEKKHAAFLSLKRVGGQRCVCEVPPA